MASHRPNWADGFAIDFEDSFATRIAMIRSFYAGDYVRPVVAIDAKTVGLTIVKRMLQ